MGSFRKNGCIKVTFPDVSIFTPVLLVFQAQKGCPEGGQKVTKSLMISVKPAEKKYEPLGV